MWLSPRVPRDAAFAEQVQRIADLYTRPLGPHERVISTDEITSLQPRPRLAATRPYRPDQPTQVEHEHRRCGALNLLATLDTRSGHIWNVIASRKRQVKFLELLEQIDRDLPESVTQVYPVQDNVRMLTRIMVAVHFLIGVVKIGRGKRALRRLRPRLLPRFLDETRQLVQIVGSDPDPFIHKADGMCKLGYHAF